MKIKQHKISVVIPAAGAGKRMGTDIPKILLELGGKTILEHTIRGFFKSDIFEMIIPVSPKIKIEVEMMLQRIEAPFPIRLVDGGKERQDSIWNALQVVDKETEIIAVHDAARPFFNVEILIKAPELLQKYSGLIAAVPAIYTMKVVEDGLVTGSPEREKTLAGQYPAGFSKKYID